MLHNQATHNQPHTWQQTYMCACQAMLWNQQATWITQSSQLAAMTLKSWVMNMEKNLHMTSKSSSCHNLNPYPIQQKRNSVMSKHLNTISKLMFANLTRQMSNWSLLVKIMTHHLLKMTLLLKLILVMLKSLHFHTFTVMKHSERNPNKADRLLKTCAGSERWSPNMGVIKEMANRLVFFAAYDLKKKKNLLGWGSSLLCRKQVWLWLFYFLLTQETQTKFIQQQVINKIHTVRQTEPNVSNFTKGGCKRDLWICWISCFSVNTWQYAYFSKYCLTTQSWDESIN